MSQISVLSFYSFTSLLEPEILLPKILYIGKRKLIYGTILLAKEGFNGSISGEEQNLKCLVGEIAKLANAKDINIKINYCSEHPFSRLKVKLKPEIVAMGVADLDASKQKGEYIEPKEWDNFITKEDVILIDTRNDYEIKLGTFKGAVNPGTDTFKEFPKWVEDNIELLQNKKIGMYCTGGIRCEKSTSYLKNLGFTEVYHLKGGILQYLEDTQNQARSWHGECFVFDERFAVDETLTPSKLYTPVLQDPNSTIRYKHRNVENYLMNKGATMLEE